jgi:hypothetical protein
MVERQTVTRILTGALAIAVALGVNTARTAARAAGDLTPGKVELKSAGALAFGPNGILFVGDSAAGAVVALDTSDKTPATARDIDVQGVDEKLAALVGVPATDVLINDVAVNPVSKKVYLSASRGRGPDAQPLIARLDASGAITLLSLDNIPHASVALADAPASAAANANQRQDPRTLTITDMTFVNGSVMVAGMSNEEWSSALRSIPYPFRGAEKGTQLQIWHSSHGRYETQAPVRTFVPYTLDGKSYVIAAYTCTPIVKIPVGDLKPGAQVKGVTIADLGAGNQPLDMIPYKKDGHDYLLIANSSFGVVKLHADSLATDKAIDSPTQVQGSAGEPYDKITALTNVQHLVRFDDGHALVVMAAPGDGPAFARGPAKGPVRVQSIALP